MNTPLFIKTQMNRVMNSGPVSSSLSLILATSACPSPHLLQVQASLCPYESAHTRVPLCFCVCQLDHWYAAKL